jgi:8-oxo-dGTP diphosphatase
MPLVRVELVLQTLLENKLATLVVKRLEDPFKGKWALPGGVIRTDLDPSIDSAAYRVLSERLGIAPKGLTQLITVGSAGREPRGPNEWGLSVIYRALVMEDNIEPAAGKRIEEWSWRTVEDLPPPDLFAFDHRNLVDQATDLTQSEFKDLRFPKEAIPLTFTLTELQTICEGMLGHKIDKSSFRRKLMDRRLVEPVEGAFQTGLKNRPAALYRLRT